MPDTRLTPRSVEALCSLVVPGLGQVLQGRLRAALPMLLALVVLVVLAALARAEGDPLLRRATLALAAAVSLWSALDARRGRDDRDYVVSSST